MMAIETQTRRTPWTKMGTRFEKVATAEEAITLAGLDWTVSMNDVYAARDQSVGLTFQKIPDKRAVVREDTGEVFNVLGNQYTPVQNRDAFKFFDAVVGQGEAIYDTAGMMRGGRNVWILAKLPGGLEVTHDDILEKYILLSNSHDGSRQFQMLITPIRFICGNTLTVAIRSGTNHFNARHTSGLFNRVNVARDIVGLSEAYFALFMRGVERLTARPMTTSDAANFFGELYQVDPAKLPNEVHPRKNHALYESLRLFEYGVGNDLPGVRGTAWAAYNAVTEYVDHVRPQGAMATAGNVDDPLIAGKRLYSSWFTSGQDIRQRAWEGLLN